VIDYPISVIQQNQQ